MDQKFHCMGGVRVTAEYVSPEWKNRRPPLGAPARPARVRMIRSVAAGLCMTALFVTGCEYAPPSNSPAKPASPASTSPPPVEDEGSPRGKTEVNKFYLAMRYTCVDGDTWESVARGFGMKAEILRAFNSSTTLKAGAVIDLRGRDVPRKGAGGRFESNPDGSGTYIVEAEDAFLGLSSRFGVPEYAIRGANSSIRGQKGLLLVGPGEKITIPSTL